MMEHKRNSSVITPSKKSQQTYNKVDIKYNILSTEPFNSSAKKTESNHHTVNSYVSTNCNSHSNDMTMPSSKAKKNISSSISHYMHQNKHNHNKNNHLSCLSFNINSPKKLLFNKTPNQPKNCIILSSLIQNKNPTTQLNEQSQTVIRPIKHESIYCDKRIENTNTRPKRKKYMMKEKLVYDKEMQHKSVVIPNLTLQYRKNRLRLDAEFDHLMKINRLYDSEFHSIGSIINNTEFH